MKRLLSAILYMFLLCGMCLSSGAQAVSDEEADTLIPDNVLMEKQWQVGALVHTNGWGLRFRIGKNLSALRQWMWEAEYSTYKSAKEVRVVNDFYSDSKSYIYGKLNSVSFLKAGTGEQFILTRKPYWGGIQLSAVAYGGVTIGLAKPVYLYIIEEDFTPETYHVVERKYDPDKHDMNNIYGRAPFLSGITGIRFYPGLYARAGLEFEFGVLNKRPKSMEAGVMFEGLPIGIPIMAYNPRQNLFLTLYLSFSIGKRYN